jgi:hypothetical protein
MGKMIIILCLIVFSGCYVVHGQNNYQDTLRSTRTEENLKNDLIKTDSHHEIANFGISAGVSALNWEMENHHPNWGYRLDICARYKASRIFGISFLLVRSVNQYYEENFVPSPTPGNPYMKRVSYEKEEWRYSGFLIGPLFSIPLGEKVNLNISPTAGYSAIVRPSYYDVESSPFALNLKTCLLINSGHRMAFSISGDYFIADSFDLMSGSVGVGLFYRFIK